jgi:glyoxylase-like metal-dependent hydrolase (beta-lactamase superfamily II)
VNGPGAQVVPGVHRLGSDRVNCYLVEVDGELVAVDAGLTGYRELIESQLREIGRRREDVRTVVLTHAHSDHTGLATWFRDAGARVLIGAGDEDLARRPRPQRTDALPLPYLRHGEARSFIWHMVRNGALRPPPLEGLETYEDGQELDVPGRPRALHTPGHTAGHCSIVFPTVRALFAGDLLCTRNPLTGREGAQPMPRAFNVDTQQSIGSLARIEDVEASVVLPGHGEPAHTSPAAAAAAARAAGPS